MYNMYLLCRLKIMSRKNKILYIIGLIIIFPIFLNSILEIYEKREKIVKKLFNFQKGSLSEDQINKNRIFWANEIKKGGYILLFRHAQREKWTDVTGFDAYELSNKLNAENETFSRATCLTNRGIEEAKLIGKIFKQEGILISEVISSPSCRAKQTAIYAFNKIDLISNSLLHHSAWHYEQRAQVAKELKKLINQIKIKNNHNVILSGHNNTLIYAKEIVVDKNEIGSWKDLNREEPGFLVLKKVDEKLIAKYKFNTFSDFVNSLIKFEIN